MLFLENKTEAGIGWSQGTVAVLKEQDRGWSQRKRQMLFRTEAVLR
jgi:hypothetical protein